MRSRLVVAAPLFLGACQPREPMGPVGVSTAGAASRTKQADVAEMVSPVPADFRTTLAKVNATPFVAQGHAGKRFEANVYASPAAKDVAFAFAGKIEPGTVILMEEVLRGREEPGPLLMMEKMPPGFAEVHGDWRYAVVDGTAATVGVLESCASCHDEAPHDHVFRIGD